MHWARSGVVGRRVRAANAAAVRQWHRVTTRVRGNPCVAAGTVDCAGLRAARLSCHADTSADLRACNDAHPGPRWRWTATGIACSGCPFRA